MIKKGILGKVIIFCMILLVMPFFSAGSIGISPAKFSFHFEPNLEKTMTFHASSYNPNQTFSVYSEGDLAQYIEMNETTFKGSGTFKVNLKLPEKLDKPGVHKAYIGAIEGEKNFDKEGVGGVTAVQAVVKVIVPYPGKYAEANVNFQNINEGEFAYYKLTINNLGSESISFTPVIKIKEFNKTIKEIRLESKNLETKKKMTIRDSIDTSDLAPGFYDIFIIIDYGKTIELQEEFKVGRLFVNITNYTYQFQEKKINKFVLEVHNLWNSKLDNVYADITVTDDGEILDTFTTASEVLNPWERTNLTGFFDASEIKPGRYIANIILHYEGKKTSKLVAVYVNEKPMDMKQIYIWGGIGGVFLVIVALLVWALIKIFKLEKNVKKKK